MPQFQKYGVVISGVYILSKAIIFLIYNYKFKVIIYDITLTLTESMKLVL